MYARPPKHVIFLYYEKKRNEYRHNWIRNISHSMFKIT
jgi:hypothetical protein